MVIALPAPAFRVDLPKRPAVKAVPRGFRLFRNPIIKRPLLPVNPSVFSRILNLKVLQSIVVLLFVPMMDVLPLLKRSAQSSLHNMSMLVHFPTVNKQSHITTRVFPRHVTTVLHGIFKNKAATPRTSL